MASGNNRIPKKYDRVTVANDSGAFVVYSIDHDIHTVELRQIGRGLSLSSISWDSLNYLDEQDASKEENQTR